MNPNRAQPGGLTDGANQSGRVAVYWHYDSDDTLLYVGITSDPRARERQHARQSQWARYVATIDVRWCVDRNAALAVELRAIQSEAPIFNTDEAAPGQAERAGLYMASHVEPLAKRLPFDVAPALASQIGRGIGTGAGRPNRGLTFRFRVHIHPLAAARAEALRSARGEPALADTWRAVIDAGIAALEKESPQ